MSRTHTESFNFELRSEATTRNKCHEQRVSSPRTILIELVNLQFSLDRTPDPLLLGLIRVFSGRL